MSANDKYAYHCTPEGYVVSNGRRYFNRPLYGSHAVRDAGRARFLALAGDRPQFLGLTTDWRKSPACPQAKCGTLNLGICRRFETAKPGGLKRQFSKWLPDFTRLETCYRAGGSIRYRLSDQLLPGVRIELEAVRLVTAEGWIIRIGIANKLQPFHLIATFGGLTDTCGNLDYQNETACAFNPVDCRRNKYEPEGSRLHVSLEKKYGREHMLAWSSIGSAWRLGNAAKMAAGPWAMTASPKGTLPLGVLTSMIGKGHSTGYIVCCRGKTAPTCPGKGPADAEDLFTSCIRYYDALSRQVRVATPDRHIDLGVRSQCLAMDACWHEPTYHHGPWSWHAPFLGWRNWYGPTVAGWHDQVRTAIRAHAASQVKTSEAQHGFKYYVHLAYPKGPRTRGALPALPHRKDISYNMGEVFVDHALHHLDWTGDVAFALELFPVIRNKLDWEEKWLRRKPSGLYENFLNTWISDAHSYNGGECIQASAYNYRANKWMDAIAGLIGKNTLKFKKRHASIRKACREALWVSEKGIFAEYRDTMGNRLRHESPELASIYHPIECGLADDFMAYQMLRFTETRLRNEYGTPRGGRLVWNSEWLPPMYSSCGLYPQENIHLLWCYYRLGLKDKAERLMNGVMASLFQGPSPGSFAHNISPTGAQRGSTDFTDTVSMFLRVVVEGLFGISYRLLAGELTLQPCFPARWTRARIQTPDIDFSYGYYNLRETVRIKSARPCRKILRLPVKTGAIAKVTLDGHVFPHKLEPGIGSCYVVVKLPKGTRENEVEIKYADIACPWIYFDPEVPPGGIIRVKTKRGAISKVFDPQSVLDKIVKRKRVVSGRVTGKYSDHTFFVKTTHGTMETWWPVDVSIKRPAPAVTCTPHTTRLSESAAAFVSLEKFYNADLQKIHAHKYLEPRPKTYSLATKSNGRFIWDWNARGYGKVVVDTSRLGNLTDKHGVYRSAPGIPFQRGNRRDGSVAVSLWRQFPRSVSIPVGKKGRELYIFLFGVTNPMQSRVENGRFSMCYDDGTTDTLALVNPDNFDDWLCAPYHLQGKTEYLGDKTHGIILKAPLKDRVLDRIELRAVANEVIIGLLGLTLRL